VATPRELPGNVNSLIANFPCTCTDVIGCFPYLQFCTLCLYASALNQIQLYIILFTFERIHIEQTQHFYIDIAETMQDDNRVGTNFPL